MTTEKTTKQLRKGHIKDKVEEELEKAQNFLISFASLKNDFLRKMNEGYQTFSELNTAYCNYLQDVDSKIASNSNNGAYELRKALDEVQEQRKMVDLFRQEVGQADICCRKQNR